MAMSRMMLAGVALALSLGLTPGVSLAQDSTPESAPSLANLRDDAEMAAAFARLTDQAELPDWVKEGLVSSPGKTVSFAGRDFLAMTGCKPHMCSPNRIAVLYDAQAGEMYGLVLEADDDGSREELRWLGIGGGPESIDGKTLLYAAITGSVENHPEDFRYQPMPAE